MRRIRDVGLISRLPAITLDEGLVEAGRVVSWRTRVSWPIVRPIYMGSEFDLGAVSTGVHGVLGIHTLVHDTVLSTELAGGERTVEAKTSSIVEARVRFDWWATPHLTLGFALGTSLIAADASAMFSIGMHLRAFDGGI